MDEPSRIPDGRILFVDDEPRVLEGLENLLFDAPEEWEFEFALGGPDALERLEEQVFDVLVTDMRMPAMNGLELMKRVREKHPNIVRVVLSGHTESHIAHEAMPLAHEFLSKPCDAEQLVGTLERALRLTKRVANAAVQRAVAGVRTLPARPATYTRLQQLVAEDAGIPEVAALVGSELALASKILHVANTAFYSRGRAIASVHNAVSLLGLKTTCSLVAAIEAWGAFEVAPWIDLDALHRHCLEVGHVASRLVDRSLADRALLAGMLHDVGELMIGGLLPDQGRQAHDAAGDEHSLVGVQRELMGFDHAAMGAHLLRLWHLDDEVALAVEHHHRIGLVDRGPIDLAVFAAEWSIVHDEGADSEPRLSEPERESIERARALRDAA